MSSQGLFRRILKGRIPAEELVQMSSDKLASKDLAEWREREAKHVSVIKFKYSCCMSSKCNLARLVTLLLIVSTWGGVW